MNKKKLLKIVGVKPKKPDPMTWKEFCRIVDMSDEEFRREYEQSNSRRIRQT